MKLLIDINDNDYELINKTVVTLDLHTAFHGKEKDKEMTFALFELVKALKNGIPYEPKGDLINRETLKEATKSFTDCDGFNPVWQIIDNAPTVEPEKVLVANVTFDKDELKRLIDERVIEPIKNGELVLQTDERPHGEWVVDIHTREVVCSNCKQSRRDTRTKHIFFCNHCGADMRGGEDNR